MTGDGKTNDGRDEEKYLKPLTPQDCIRSCIEEKKTDSAINGVTVEEDDAELKECYCERNMAKVISGQGYKTCFLVPN